jgi:type IV pilus assembly protein PilW
MTHFRFAARQRGMGIVETMVGILIGMVVVLAVYNVFALAEGYKRTTVGVADAQTTGLFAQFVLAREIGNAGNGLSIDAAYLANCTLANASWVTPPSFGAGSAIRPLPVLIRDGGGANQPDELVVTYGTPSRVVNSIIIVDKPMLAATDTIYVQSPNGFRPGDRIIVNDTGGNCELTRVTAVTPGDSTGNLTTGMVGLSTDPTYPLTKLYKPTGATDGPRVLNLGPDGSNPATGASTATRTLFDVVNNQLRTTDLFTNAPAVPIAQNIVLLKAQYGVDCANNGVITWTSATASGVCGLNYRPVDFAPLAGASAWNATLLSRIRAVRIAIVVRSDEPDLKDPALVGQTATLFDCSTHDAACQGSIAIDNTVLADGWRHRTYETIVPMRNAIYNNGT